MKGFVVTALVSLASLSTVALANHHENCDVNGKKVHVKDKAACEKKKGKFVEVAAPEVKAPEVAAPEVKAPAVPAAAPKK